MIERITFPVYEFTFKGLSDCLMHRDDVEAADELSECRKRMKKGESKAGDDRSPAWTWIEYLYHDTKKVVAPIENVMRALAYGGAKLKLEGRTTYRAVTQSGITPLSDSFEFFHQGGKSIAWADIVAMHDLTFKQMVDEARRMGFRLFTKRAKVGQSKHVRVRPRFSNWEIKGQVEVTDDRLTDEVVEAIFEETGRGGMFDWRPSSPTPGRWGLFQASVKRVV